MDDDYFDSSDMTEEEYEAALREYAERQADELQEALEESFGDAVVFTTETGAQETPRFTVEFTFDSDEMTPADVAEWAEFVVGKLPEGAVANVVPHAVHVNVEDLTEAHYGATVKVWLPQGVVEGVLEGAYAVGEGTGDARILIIDGRAWRSTFGVAEVNV